MVALSSSRLRIDNKPESAAKMRSLVTLRNAVSVELRGETRLKLFIEIFVRQMRMKLKGNSFSRNLERM